MEIQSLCYDKSYRKAYGWIMQSVYDKWSNSMEISMELVKCSSLTYDNPIEHRKPEIVPLITHKNW